METKKPAVLVTGVSSGIGLALLDVLTAEGFQVFGSVRKQSDADRVARQFRDAFVPLIFDVSDEAAVQEAAGKVRVHDSPSAVLAQWWMLVEWVERAYLAA